MAELNVGNLTLTDMTNTLDDVTIDPMHLDGVSNQDETTYMFPNFCQQLGWYLQSPEIKSAIDTRATWTLADYQADTETKVILDHVSGWGVDTCMGILKNLSILARIGGDSFAEIIRDADSGILLNLKPLNTENMTIVVDNAGIIKRYEQRNRSSTGKTDVKKFKPEDILHFCNKRIGDQIHGISDIDVVQKIIIANNETFEDTQTLIHRNIFPVRIIEVDDDNPTKLAQVKSQYEQQIAKKEVLVVPKGTMTISTEGMSNNATFNPLPWREHLKDYFYQVVGIPQIILGSAKDFTEAAAKIAYLSFEQSLKEEQRNIEAQIWNQLYLRITLEIPASLKNELISDNTKDGQLSATQPSDTAVGGMKPYG